MFRSMAGMAPVHAARAVVGAGRDEVAARVPGDAAHGGAVRADLDAAPRRALEAVEEAQRARAAADGDGDQLGLSGFC